MLQEYLTEITDKIIAQSIFADTSEAQKLASESARLGSELTDEESHDEEGRALYRGQFFWCLL